MTGEMTVTVPQDEFQIVAATPFMPEIRAELDVQISTAKAYPRSITSFRQILREITLVDEEVAASMMYALPARRGSEKKIEGPSIRLAEAMAYAWGNFTYGGRIARETQDSIVALGYAWDLQMNVRTDGEVTRRIVDKYGKRYSDDMISVTRMAAIAVAKRNAILSIGGLRAFVPTVAAETREVALGKGLTMEQRRKRCLDEFAKLGVKEKDSLRLAGVKGADDLGIEQLSMMLGIRTALKDGEGGLTVQKLLASLDEPVSVPNKPVAFEVGKVFPQADKEK